MKKMILMGLLTVALGGGLSGCQAAQPATSHPHAAAKRPPKSVAPLTASAVTRDPKLKYAALIYYAVKETNVQRWQEVASFHDGWQVEIDRVHGTKRYSVWPSMHPGNAVERLEPNWFTLSGQHVTYQSFVVHSGGDYTVVKTTLKHVLKRLNARQAGNKVREMPVRMTVKDNTK